MLWVCKGTWVLVEEVRTHSGSEEPHSHVLLQCRKPCLTQELGTEDGGRIPLQGDTRNTRCGCWSWKVRAREEEKRTLERMYKTCKSMEHALLLGQLLPKVRRLFSCTPFSLPGLSCMFACATLWHRVAGSTTPYHR